MKLLMRAGVLTSLIFMGWSYNQASADTNMTFATKCGALPQSGNPSSQQINCLLTNAALEEDIPPEVIKAVAAQESGWKQFDDNGQPYHSSDGGIGIMQIQTAEHPNYDPQKLENNITYNIEAGVEILSSMYNRTDLPKINGAERDVIENWYFPVMAYNGTKPANSPLYQANGTKNTNAYQEKVFALLEKDSFLGDTPLGQYPFSTKDFSYQTNSGQNITFNKLEYTLTDQMHASNYFFQKGD
ncbi:MAG TPA: transglycosylase SLT domain-containing protein, partial [Candidatus Angelobacter sp.]|nr:transglycosylase SLT domain-containing protein [Candidatus Angelobacter sp.]